MTQTERNFGKMNGKTDVLVLWKPRMCVIIENKGAQH